ncbi:TPA_asm: hypothetical protein [Girado virus 1]|nr:TPA_asm: hypothetical protein [Girado virus 1]
MRFILLILIISSCNCQPDYKCSMYTSNYYPSIFHIDFNISEVTDSILDSKTNDNDSPSVCNKRFIKQLRQCRNIIASKRSTSIKNLFLNKKTLELGQCKFSSIYRKYLTTNSTGVYFKPTSYFYLNQSTKMCLCFSLYPYLIGLKDIVAKIDTTVSSQDQLSIYNYAWYNRIPKKYIFRIRYLCDFLPSSSICSYNEEVINQLKRVSTNSSIRKIRSTNIIDFGNSYNIKNRKKMINKKTVDKIIGIHSTPLHHNKLIAKKCNTYPDFVLQLIINIRCDRAKINQKTLILKKQIRKTKITLIRLMERIYFCKTYTYFFGSTQTNRFIIKTILNESSLYLPFNQYHGKEKVHQLYYNEDPRFYCYYYHRSEEVRINIHHINATHEVYLSENGQFTGLDVSTNHCSYVKGSCKLSDGSIISWDVNQKLLDSSYTMFGLHSNGIIQGNTVTFPTIQSTYIIDRQLTPEEYNKYIVDELKIYSKCVMFFDSDHSIIIGDCNNYRPRTKRSSSHPIDHQFNLTITQAKQEIQAKLDYIQDIYYPFINLTSQTCERINDMFKQSNKIKMKYLDDFIQDKTRLNHFVYEKKKSFLIIYSCEIIKDLSPQDTSIMIENKLYCHEYLPIKVNGTILFLLDDGNVILSHARRILCQEIKNKYYLFNQTMYIYNGIGFHKITYNNVKFQLLDSDRQHTFTKGSKWIYNDHTLNFGMIEELQSINKKIIESLSNSKNIDDLLKEKMDLGSANQFSILDDLASFSPLRFFVPLIIHLVILIVVIKIIPFIVRTICISIKGVKKAMVVQRREKVFQYIQPPITPLGSKRSFNSPPTPYDTL